MDALPLWNFEYGDNIRIVCYTNCDEAQLVINGINVGDRKKYDDEHAIISWDVAYAPGSFKVIAYKDGKEVESNVVKTTKAPYAIKATLLENEPVQAGQVCHVMIEVVDEDGNRVMNADNEIRCRIENGAHLLAMDNADPSDMGNHRDNKERVNMGRLLTYVKVNEPGAKIKFSANWIRSAEIEIR